MEYMRPDMVDHGDESENGRQRPAREQEREIGSDVSADPGAGPSQVPSPPVQRGDGEQEMLDDDNPRGRANQAYSVDQQRAWQNADEGAEQTYNGSDPVD